MGSLETGGPLKKDHHHHHQLLIVPRPSSPVGRSNIPFGQRPRSRSGRWRLLKRVHHLHWICGVFVFFSFLIFLQTLLPGSGSDKSGGGGGPWKSMNNVDSRFWAEIDGVDFGEGIKFEPARFLVKFQNEFNDVNSRGGVRFGNRKPLLALVFGDLQIDSQQILMSTVSIALMEIGYEFQVYAIDDGPAYSIWEKIGARVNVIGSNGTIDWLQFDGVIISSIGAMDVFYSLLQEPFKNVPLVWTIHDCVLSDHLNNRTEFVNDWKKFFNRANVIVFPNYALPMFYSAFDSGNYFVIPGSPAEAWEADTIMASSLKDDNGGRGRGKMGYGRDDFLIVIVGSKFMYKGLWLEHALVLKALLPFNTLNPRLKVVILAGDSSSNYSIVVETIALNLGFARDTVKHVSVDEDSDMLLNLADLVIYGSFLEEQSFPDILVKAMCLEKPIIAPDLPMISKYVHDRVNGYLFKKDNIDALTRTLGEVELEGKISPLASNIASVGRQTAKNVLALETVEGYVLLMEKILKLPSEVAACRSISDIPMQLKGEWQWNLFGYNAAGETNVKTTRFLEKIDGMSNQIDVRQVVPLDETIMRLIWKEEKYLEMGYMRKRREDEELKDRTDQQRGTWEEVYRNAKRADRVKNDLHERDDGELERTGQPLCIYEPYIGEGTWPFLHRPSLYRGIGLSSRGRRPGVDDIDAASRLSLLNNPYYRDALGEYGAFLAIANRVDRIHKNAWIGFQSWRVTAQKESLSKTAETAILEAIQARKHGDTLYFWARMDEDRRNPLQQDFWSFCDAINAGNCRFAFSEAMKKMYGINSNGTCLPSMPVDGKNTWSVMHSWVLPTKSFMEFIMFSRMFVNALDEQVYDGHPKTGHCYLSLWKDKHCYARMMELVVNVWAYHSARRMVYVNPKTGAMQEQHGLKSRRGGRRMWVKWFSYATLKGMDEDLAEEVDSDGPSSRRWLWPSTGEVFWQGMYEKERNLKNMEKEKRRKQSRDKLERMRRKQRQKTIGKYVKPSPEEEDGLDLNSNTNTTTTL